MNILTRDFDSVHEISDESDDGGDFAVLQPLVKAVAPSLDEIVVMGLELFWSYSQLWWQNNIL